MVNTTTQSPARTAPIPVFERAPLALPNLSAVDAKIIDAARLCLLQYSSAKLSLSDVARLAGVSRKTVYNHFTDRKTLLRMVLEVVATVIVEDLDRCMSSHENLEDQVEAAAARFSEWIAASNNARWIVEGDSATAIMTDTAGVIAKLIDVFRVRISEAVVRGEVCGDIDIDQSAEWIGRTIFSLYLMPGVTFNRDDPAEAAGFVKVRVVRGLQ